MTSTSIPQPSTRYSRSRYRRTGRSGPNLEMMSWLFMRLSGLVLVFLVIGHLFVNLWLGEGVKAIDFGFVAGKWANPFWQVWDLLMLWLGMIHGANGVRTIISDYVERPRLRQGLKYLLAAVTVVIILLGTLVIFTFDPCLPGVDSQTMAKYCQA
ncbi:succinate dehydrogenase hydrophobic membrane anchor subunit [Helcobacillus massiliensis]|nr:succinate dehydrogenase hydrophobic membrane anchor subunit [Helcobacillus massiliensis]MCT1557518.1 succinate dehydrogenase hydrophobic membrane anchor subunit [Helcobacillus massiliensis]MCT2036301.1 succinate dehydrogenase hydrophobic membrane anchor subunit [Helcobacillus massiliensis]MCT2331957.1 succinate dehydrogenase hydrophobic membrane anchor subunit [Helcobacillus massiliensis]MDK7742796.1 succinate dehydrogenase hydrophobic membrane anchor subunit [Helcobacillus massiliensis]WOO